MIRLQSHRRFIYLTAILLLAGQSLIANAEDEFKNRVNMALRQTAHELLLAQNDSTSKIAQVEYQGPNGFMLPLEKEFSYGDLPTIFQNALDAHGITESYELVIKDCDTDIPLLGFNKESYENGNIPCATRANGEFCANIFVQFNRGLPVAEKESSALFWLLIPLVGGAGFVIFKKLQPQTEKEDTQEKLTLGSYQYDPKNQVLLLNDKRHSLTFRENKLLLLLASSPNEVLTRDQIMESVWGDEGVVVGRSLDVFISRLRKLLKGDARVQIKSIHGVGYRLELA